MPTRSTRLKILLINKIIIIVTTMIFFIQACNVREGDIMVSASKEYKCLYNHELLILFSSTGDVSDEKVDKFIKDIADTDVDAVMCCPLMLRTNLWNSVVDPHWSKEAPFEEPSGLKYYEAAKQYILAGNDPVLKTMQACRKYGKAFFINYRMNDAHYTSNKEWPTHNSFWKNHSEYWLKDSDDTNYARLLNYMEPEVRNYYFNIIKELCEFYNIDGVELDFERYPIFFRSEDLEQGTLVMNDFVGTIRKMLDEYAKKRKKDIKLCVRVPETLEKCKKAGLDPVAWDEKGYIDMVNISSHYFHTMQIDIEGFQKKIKNAKLYGEMNFATYQSTADKNARRYITPQIYQTTAFSFLDRGLDGISLFNFHYAITPGVNGISQSNFNIAVATTFFESLKNITDLDKLKKLPKQYAIGQYFGTFPAKNKKEFDLYIADENIENLFKKSVMRIETKEDSTEVTLNVWFNGTPLVECDHDAELFPQLLITRALAKDECLKHYEVPVSIIFKGYNKIKIQNTLAAKDVTLLSVEIGLY